MAKLLSDCRPRRPRPWAKGALAVTWLLLATAACAGRSAAPAPPATAPSPAAATPTVVTHVLSPAELDPAADKYPAPQYAYVDPRTPGPHRLVVYLVGANNKPDRGRSMGEYLAGLGFLVVVPGYANDYDIRALCQPAGTPDPECHGKLRLEAFEGQDHSPHIAISRPNSLEARIGRMLTTLAAREPQIGWDRFVTGGEPRWQDIIVAGHSHGASSSALIGKVRKVARVVMLSGPFDNRAGAPAPWTGRAGLTPTDRVFAFSHMQEEQYDGHIKNWAAMGLPALGAITVVEKAAPPYAGSHQLVTALAPAPGGGAHGTTAAGKAAPLGPDGHYVFGAAWRYLFGL